MAKQEKKKDVLLVVSFFGLVKGVFSPHEEDAAKALLAAFRQKNPAFASCYKLRKYKEV